MPVTAPAESLMGWYTKSRKRCSPGPSGVAWTSYFAPFALYAWPLANTLSRSAT